MPKRTQIFNQLPWSGGLNTSVDPGAIPPGQLVQADNIVFDTSGTRKKREGIDSFVLPAGAGDVIAISDFWHEIANGKQQRIINVKNNLLTTVTVSVISDLGVESTPTEIGTVTFTPITSTQCHIETVGNFAILSFNGGTTPKKIGFVNTAVAEVSTVTYETKAASDSADYTVVYDTTGQPWAVALDLTGADAEPTGATWVAIGAAFKTQADISGDTTAANVAATVETAFNSLTGFTAVITTDDTAADGTMTFTSVLSAFARDAEVFDAIDGTPDITIVTNTQGKTLGEYFIQDLGGSPPDFSICREHLGRLWTNDKTRPDFLHYSSTGNPEEWNGEGDSGGINDLGVGDGDPDGITAIFPPFKAQLFVAKRYRIYRITGFTPLDFQVKVISTNLGCISHRSAVGVEQDDVVFASERGIHSVIATADFGDLESAYLSADIQPTYQDDLNKDRRDFIQGAYIPIINSIAFSVTRVGESKNRDLYLLNIPTKQWYRWPDISCEAIATVKLRGRQTMLVGEDNGVFGLGRLLETQKENTFRDFNSSAINLVIKSGLIFPDNSVYTIKGFKKLGLVFRNKGKTELDTTFTVDDFTEQQLLFTIEGGSDLLGSTFILGASKLAGLTVLAPLTLPIDGYGRGFQLTIENMQIDEPTEIYGFFVELDQRGDSQESSSNREAS